MEESKQLDFIQNHLWSPLEYSPPQEIFNKIEDAAEITQTYLDNLTDQDSITISWHISDVQWQLSQINQRQETSYQLTDAECREILQIMKRKHDANIGISWDVIECYIDDCLNKRNQKN